MTLDRSCKEKHCDRLVHARDMCHLHYDRWYRKNQLTPIPPRPAGPLRIPLSRVIPEMRALVWAQQQVFDELLLKLILSEKGAQPE